MPSKAKIFPDTLKWSETLKRRKKASAQESFSRFRIRKSLYRPFVTVIVYRSELFIDRPGLVEKIFPQDQENLSINFLFGGRQNFNAIASKLAANLNLYSADAAVALPRYRYDNTIKIDNITDWALDIFQANYSQSGSVTKDDIFAYIYAVLQDPIYLETYTQNLKREFPRIPFYKDFAIWRDWGHSLLNLHVNYENALRFPIGRVNTSDRSRRISGRPPRPILRSNSVAGNIIIDTDTQLTGIPTAAWHYKLGNRAAIDWILDQYKEKKPKDATIREKFDNYRLADYKEEVIDLLSQVTTVSLETIKITNAMRKLPRP